MTGSDFPELVENNGERLRTELGITNSMHARNIMRHVKARMVGLESELPKVVPNTPKLIHDRMLLKLKKLNLNRVSPFISIAYSGKSFQDKESEEHW